jgi:hypothetical protein
MNLSRIFFFFFFFFGTRRLITVFGGSGRCPLPWAGYVQSAFPPYFSGIHSSIVLPSTPASSEWSLAFMFSDQSFVSVSYYLTRATFSAHPIHLDLFTLTDEVYIRCEAPHRAVFSSLAALTAIFSNTIHVLLSPSLYSYIYIFALK